MSQETVPTMTANSQTGFAKPTKRQRLLRNIAKSWQIYVLLALPVIYVFIFSYMPMYGVQIAFRNFSPVRGFWGSDWVGLMHFRNFFNSFFWGRLVRNTLLLNFYSLVWAFPIPVFLALLLHQLGSQKFRKTVQTIIYMPNFISVVVIVGMLFVFLSPTTGIVNIAIQALGGSPIVFMNRAEWFRTIFIASSVWQGAGFGTIIYFATLSGINVELYEAATVDGALKRHKIWHIDIPHLIPLIGLFVLKNVGTMLASETQRTLLMQTAGNMAASDTLGPFIFRMGIVEGQHSYTTAINLMLNVVNMIFLVIANKVAQKTGEGQSSLW